MNTGYATQTQRHINHEFTVKNRFKQFTTRCDGSKVLELIGSSFVAERSQIFGRATKKIEVAINPDSLPEQYGDVYDELYVNPDSMDATMFYVDKTRINMVQYIIRGNKLHATVTAKSTELFDEFSDDWTFQKLVLVTLCEDLRANAGYTDLEVGNIVWQANVLYVTEENAKRITW